MTPRRLFAGVAVAASLAGTASVTASTASASPTFASTYSLASRICANVAKGKGPRALRPDAPQVLADCAALESSFTTARTLIAQEAPLKVEIAAATPAAGALCNVPPAATESACVQTRTHAQATIKSLEAQEHTIRRGYGSDINTARSTFWAAIRSLPGGTAVAPKV